MLLSRRNTKVMRPMSMGRALFFIWSWIVLSGTSCAQEHSAARDVIATIDNAASRGPLVSFAKAGREHFLFGTLHVGRLDFVPMDWGVNAALLKSDVLEVLTKPHFDVSWVHGQTTCTRRTLGAACATVTP
jgi:hypothetical protein